ncbi:MAG: NB-ARC domain-containing protein [Phormidesmis sp.]
MVDSGFSEAFLTKAAKDKRVSDGELAALRLALSKSKSKDIAKQLHISEAAARKRLGEVYKKFAIKGSGPGKLDSLREHLFAIARDSSGSSSTEKLAAEKLISRGSRRDRTAYRWNDAPTLNLFEGRHIPLGTLKPWILQPAGTPKLLTICGIGGIGKTYLARKLSEDIGDYFQQVVWLSIKSTQQPVETLQTLLKMLENVPDSKPDRFESEVEPLTVKPTLEVGESLIQKIVDRLSQQRCLVILDGFEQAFKGFSTSHAPIEVEETQFGGHSNDRIPTFDASRRQQASLYEDGFEVYGKLLEAIQNAHPERAHSAKARSAKAQSSCVILTSREKPRDILLFSPEDSSATCLYTLDGLDDSEVEALLSSFRLKGSTEDHTRLIARYCGHPMAIRLAANTIRDVFFGKISSFLDQEISVFDDLRSVLKTQFKRLPPVEQEVMYWLAINYRPCSLEDLQADIVATDHKENLIYTIKSLQRRFLVESEESDVPLFHLHPIVAEYVLDRFIRAIFQDLMRGDLYLFNSHALMKADAEDELREFQREKIVEPILNRLKNYCKSLYRVDDYLSDRLDKFRKNNHHRLGYAGGNFINLLVQLSKGEALYKKDFSQLTIWQAYLQGVRLRDVSFNRCQLDRSVFTETLSDVMAIALSSPQSQQPSLLACGDTNGIVRLWNTQPVGQKSIGEKCAEWAAHSGWVRTIAFIPHQSLLVTGGDDNRIKLWRLPTGQPLAQPVQVWQKSAYDWVNTVAVSPDGQVIASGGDDKITLYLTHNGKVVHQFCEQIADQKWPLSAEGPSEKRSEKKIEKGSENNNALTSPIVSKAIQQNRIRTLAFSPDGRWLASCGEDYIIRLWAVSLDDKATAPVLKAKLTGHTASVRSLCFSPDSQRLVSGSEDRSIRVWDVDKGKFLQALDRPSDHVRSVAISEDGQFLASGGDDCQVRLWDLKTLKHIKDISAGQSRIWSVAFQQQQGKLLLSAGGDKQLLKLWQITPNTSKPDGLKVRPIRTYQGYTSGIRAVAFLGARIVGGGDSGELSVWDVEAGDRKATLHLHQGRIWSVAVDAQNARIASASDDHTVRLWDANTGQCLTTLTGHNNWVRTVAFSHRGGLLASGGDDCTIRVWNMASGFCLNILEQSALEQPNKWIRSVAFDPTNSRKLISGGDDQVVRLWDRKRESYQLLAQHEHRICSVAYSPDGKMIASGSDDATVILWDAEKSEVIHRFANADLGVKAVTFSPNGEYLAWGGDDQLVYVWKLTNTNPEKHCWVLRPKDYAGVAGGIRSVAFSPDSRFVISGGLDEMVRIGDLSQMKSSRQRMLRPLIQRDRPYENTKIEDIRGLSVLQIANLLALGAVNRTRSLLS